MLSRLYGTLATRRRRWYESRSDRRRRLRQPVISVGALAVGGSGKTPTVAHLAELLVSMGEQPAVLSRGYARRHRADGVVVVSDRGTLRSDVDLSGDEPLMLARQLPHVSVVVCDDRYLAGRLAESSLGATVHLLDDGFQHFSLERAVDLVLLDSGDLDDTRTLPAGRLREPIELATKADILLVDTEDPARAREVGDRVGLKTVFRIIRRLQIPYDAATLRATQPPRGARVLAVAGIGRPSSFTDALGSVGYDVVETMAFTDHHGYTPSDLKTIAARAQALAVDVVMTTEKDLERFRSHAPWTFPLLAVPLRVSVEPADAFQARLGQALTAARTNHVDVPIGVTK